MTYFNDAEFAAIKMARIAHAEDITGPNSAAMIEVVADLSSRHADDGILALAISLARQYAAALSAIADARDTTVEVIIDEFEQHKLVQVETEGGAEG